MRDSLARHQSSTAYMPLHAGCVLHLRVEDQYRGTTRYGGAKWLILASPGTLWSGQPTDCDTFTVLASATAISLFICPTSPIMQAAGPI